MRIGIDARLWGETGVGRYIRNLVQNLQEIDKANEYVLFMRAKDSREFKVQSSKFKVVSVDIPWHTLEEQIRFPQILYKENLDLVHFPYFSAPIFYKKPYVITIHDLIINHFPTGKASTLPLSLYKLKYLGYQYIVSRAVNRAKKIIVPTQAVKADLINTLDVEEKKIGVTYEGIDPQISNKNTKYSPRGEAGQIPNTKYFLYVGNAYPHKNLERLIKAFSQFRLDENLDVQLLLIGKEDYFFKLLQKKIKKENYSGILIRHDVKDNELADLYKGAIALISASLMEGFGLPPLEAMANSCPVLLSNIPSFKEVCGDSAVYFDPYSVDGIKEKLQTMLNLNKNDRKQIIDKGLLRASKFSWKKMAKETLNVYESCTSTSSA